MTDLEELSDSDIEKDYIEAGKVFGDAVSYIFFGECVNFEKFLAEWEKWEIEYAKRGYRTISLDTFVQFGGYGQPIAHLLRKRRDEREEPILHAQIYRERFLGKINPVLNINRLVTDGRMQSGIYQLPSTEMQI